ncbi:hypothetical protein CRG98_006032 [Punica granatum]|uniref:Uncharacterized protein n=1 Tax=Punica granatum TaxID=22663 RepID=A0A2I0KYP7_PUNGR|nr:hypothetical protein CRG98_006032 [Punica granatum]
MLARTLRTARLSALRVHAHTLRRPLRRTTDARAHAVYRAPVCLRTSSRFSLRLSACEPVRSLCACPSACMHAVLQRARLCPHAHACAPMSLPVPSRLSIRAPAHPSTGASALEHPSSRLAESPDSPALLRLCPRIPRLGIIFPT